MSTRTGPFVLAIAVLGAIAIAPARDATATVPRESITPAARTARLQDAVRFGRLPASFDANAGQFDERVRYVAQAGGIVAWLVDGEVVLRLGDDDPGTAEGALRPRAPTKCGGVLRMRFPSVAAPRGEARLSSTSNWFLGSDPARWRTDVPSFGGARYAAASPGVDVVWRGTRSALAYDVVVAPGADLAAFSFELEGAESVRVDAASGDLVVTTRRGAELRHSRPRCFQEFDGARRDVVGRFVADGPRVSFAVDGRDRSRELVIDPTLEYSSYLGGNGQDLGIPIAATPSGDLLVGGSTLSTNFPLASPVQSQWAGPNDAFAARIRADGTGLVFSTYIGGSGSESCLGIALGAGGDVYLAGYTNSTNLPTASAVQPGYGGGFNDAFVVRLPASGNQLTYSTYVGGNGDDSGENLAVDASGSAYVVGRTVSSNFPLVNARQSTPGGGASDAFVTKLSPSGTGIVYSTYHGGNYDEFAYGCALDSAGSLVVVGITLSTNFPTSNAYQFAYGGGYADGYVSKFSASGSALVFSTYLGGSGADHLFGVAVDSTGAASVCGRTQSTNYPTISATQTANGGGYDAIVTRFQPSGASLAFSTYLGGSAEDRANGIALDPAGGIVVTGATASTDFPVRNALQSGYAGGTFDGFVARFAPGTWAMGYATYFGGGSEDLAYRVTIDSSGNVCFTGRTASSDFPTQSPYQASNAGGNGDVCVVRFGPTLPAAPTTLTATLVGASTSHLTWTDRSGDETGFEVQRRMNAGAYTTYASVPAGTTAYDDTSLFASQTYTYRVCAVGVEGQSPFTNEASVVAPLTVPYPPMPRAPDGLAALVVSANEVDLSWRDRSNDELVFEVQRADGGAEFGTVVTVPQDGSSFADATVLPGWPVSYRVRALAVQGPSLPSAVTTVTPPGAMTLVTTKGLVADATKARRDKLSWSAALSPADAAAVLDPRVHGLRLQAGPPAAPVVVAIPPGDAKWKAKKSKLTWKSAPGVVPKVAVVIDVAKKTISLTASALDFAAAPSGPVRMLVAVGNTSGGLTEAWPAGKKAGTFAPPKP